MKHCLPPLHDESESEADGSDSDDERNPLAAKDVQQTLKPFFGASRAIVKFYKHDSDQFIRMEQEAKDANISCEAYQSETPTRWSSSWMSAVSTLRNNQAHMMTKAKHNTRAPDGYDATTLALGRQLCTILTPFKMATKLLEGDKVTSSVYLPAFHSISNALCRAELKIPKELTRLQRLGI